MKAKSILIFNPFGIGDVLFSTPLIRNLKDNLPGVSLVYLCNRRVYPLLKDNIFLNKVMIFEKDEWRSLARRSKLEFLKVFFSFRAEVKKANFDVVLDLSLNSQYGFFFKAAGIKTRIGLNYKNRGRFLTHKINIKDGYSDKHVARYYLDLLKFLNITPIEHQFDLFISQQALEPAESILNNHLKKRNNLLIGVCPASGDSWQKTAYYKRWPKENFLKLCERLKQELGADIILFGSKSETDVCSYIYEQMKEKPLNLCGKLDLEEFFSLVSLCGLIVTNDGGSFHVAQALRKKGVVFFGPVSEKVYGAYPDESTFFTFKKDIECRPCYRRFKFKGCSYDKKCLRDIGPAEVFSVIKGMI